MAVKPEAKKQCAAQHGEIQQGDAYDLIEGVQEGSIDLVLTSPPYWGLRSYGSDLEADTAKRWEAEGCPTSRIPPYSWYRANGGALGLEPYPSWYVAHLVELFGRMRSRLKASGSVWVNLGDTYFARWASIRDEGRQGYNSARHRRRTPSGGYLLDKQLLLIPARFAIAMQDDGWILRNDLIWAKPNVLPRPEKDRLRLSHEHWLHFVLKPSKGRPRYYYDLDECESGANDVVTVAAAHGSDGHSATFPPQLIRHRISSTCPPGGLMVDPFCGTGRSVVEATSLGRRGIGFELSEVHAAAAMKNVRRVMARGAESAHLMA